MNQADTTAMADTTVKKIDSEYSPKGEQGQVYLASGKRVAMRLWDEEPGDKESEEMHAHDYEVVGYAIEGQATLHLDGQTVQLNAGDSWVVPAGSPHRYEIREHFKAVEATAPPARVHGREE